MDNNSKNILIVDDETKSAESLAIGLRKAGYHPQVANNGFEGTERLKKAKFEYILCDINMPDMDGWEFAQKVKTVTDADFIFYTADSRTYKKSNFSNYPLLIKPIELGNILELLQQKGENNNPNKGEN